MSWKDILNQQLLFRWHLQELYSWVSWTLVLITCQLAASMLYIWQRLLACLAIQMNKWHCCPTYCRRVQCIVAVRLAPMLHHCQTVRTIIQGKKLEHVGILHHNPNGEVAFFHRTSGGKPNPLATPGEFFHPHFTSLPLHPKAAWDMFDGAAEDQNYRYPRSRIKPMALEKCKLSDGKQLLYSPDCSGTSVRISEDTLPLPVITQNELRGTMLGQAFEVSNLLFTELQQFMHEPDHHFLRDLPQLR